MTLSPALKDPHWRKHLNEQAQEPYFQKLQAFLSEREKDGAVIYPPRDHIYRTFELTPFKAVKVVILGQDPYHGPGQAMGLSFSVPKGVKQPPSLRNILKEMQADIGGGGDIAHGDLTKWAEQGVLLLNTALTVEDGKAGAHSKKGWAYFTDSIIQKLSARGDVVFVLWGAHAQKKADYIDTDKNLILTAPHPSPLSAHRGFFGSKPFSQANAYLKAQGQKEINWTAL